MSFYSLKELNVDQERFCFTNFLLILESLFCCLRCRACLSEPNSSFELGQGWATPGTLAELGTRALLSGTVARPRKRDPPSNEKVINLQVAVISDETRCLFLHFRLLTIRYLI